MYLYGLMPDGKYFSLSEARQRASYAYDRSKRTLLQPDRKETIQLLIRLLHQNCFKR
jgi:hypothetical protein